VLCQLIFDRCSLFTAISEGSYREIEATIVYVPDSRLYSVNLDQVQDEQTLYERLLLLFEVPIPAPGLQHVSDACLDAIGGLLAQRREHSVLVVIANVDDLVTKHFQLFLDLLDFMSWLAMKMQRYPKSNSTHQVYMRVLFVGRGHNYPDRPPRLAQP
jgi:hypothetical protein